MGVLLYTYATQYSGQGEGVVNGGPYGLSVMTVLYTIAVRTYGGCLSYSGLVYLGDPLGNVGAYVCTSSILMCVPTTSVDAASYVSYRGRALATGLIDHVACRPENVCDA